MVSISDCNRSLENKRTSAMAVLSPFETMDTNWHCPKEAIATESKKLLLQSHVLSHWSNWQTSMLHCKGNWKEKRAGKEAEDLDHSQ